MDHSSETTNLDLIEEDILTYTDSDEALEVAAGAERGANPTIFTYGLHPGYFCC